MSTMEPFPVTIHTTVASSGSSSGSSSESSSVSWPSSGSSFGHTITRITGTTPSGKCPMVVWKIIAEFLNGNNLVLVFGIVHREFTTMTRDFAQERYWEKECSFQGDLFKRAIQQAFPCQIKQQESLWRALSILRNFRNEPWIIETVDELDTIQEPPHWKPPHMVKALLSDQHTVSCLESERPFWLSPRNTADGMFLAGGRACWFLEGAFRLNGREELSIANITFNTNGRSFMEAKGMWLFQGRIIALASARKEGDEDGLVSFSPNIAELIRIAKNWGF